MRSCGILWVSRQEVIGDGFGGVLWDSIPYRDGCGSPSEGVLVEQFRTSDQLDGKAGALLGFAGLLAAIVVQLDELNVAVVMASRPPSSPRSSP